MANSPPSVGDDSGGGGEARPGIRLQWPASDRPFMEGDKDLLESRLEVKIGEHSVKEIFFSDDKIQAYVELKNESDIDRVLSSSLNLHRDQPPLVVEQFDLKKVWHPYLIVKGLEEWMIEDIDMIKNHFQAEANGAQIQSIEVHGSETIIIMFASPQVALRLGSSTDFLGITIQLEVGYTSSAPKVEKEVLAVRGLPRTKIPVEKMENALLKHFSKHSKLEATDCRIINGVGYLTFEDPKAVQSVISSPPTASFTAESTLQLSVVPISQMENSAADDNSGVSASPPLNVRSDSTASYGSLFSPSSSSSSVHMKAGFSRELSRDSFDSISSAENFTRDPEDSLRVRASSTSDRQYNFGRPPSSQPQQRQIQDAISTLPPVPENPPKFGVSPMKSDEHMPVQDIDTSYNHTKEVQLESTSHSTRVHIDDVPPHKRERSLIELYMKSLAFTECTVKQYGKSFMATFQQPIDFRKLKEKGQTQHLDSYVLSLYALDSTKQILVSGLGTTIPPYFVKTHFEVYSGKESVDDVKTLPSDRAVITFKDSKSVDVIMSEPKCMQLGDTSISITEYYDFMSYDEEDCSDVSPSMAASHSQQQVIPPPQQPPKYKWGPVVEVVNKMKAAWLESTLTTLNNTLKPIQAEGSMEADSSGTPWLKVEPLDGSEEMSDWQKQVQDVLNEHFPDYREEAIPLPDYCQADIMKSTELLASAQNDVTVTSAGSSLIIAGGSASVQETILKAKDMISDLEVSTEEKTYPRKHVNYLKKFCKHALDSIPAVLDYTLDPDLKVIVVSGNKKVRESFWCQVQSEISNIQEKSIPVEHEHFKLLSSNRGKERIEEVIGMKRIMFELESNPPDYTLCFLSPPHVEKETLKRIRDKFKTLLISGSFSISCEKLRLCSDKKWRELIESIQKNIFVLVTVEDSSKKITVTGEPIHLKDVIEKIENFLSEHTSVEERLNIDFHEWRVMESSFKNDLDKIKHNMGKHVKITWPEPELRVSVCIVIRGDPNKVDDVKHKLEELQSKVCSKEEKLCNIPAAIKVVESMEDKIRVLEGQYGACIDVSLTSDDTSSQSSSVAPSKLCSATCPNEVRISVYAGDFTKHNHVDSIITFIPPNPTYQEEIFKLLFMAGGPPFQDDFKRKIGQFIDQSPGEIFKSSHGQLQCNEILHCFLHPWVNGSSNEEFYLEECLNKALHSTRHCNTILFTPSSLKYPAATFANSMISSLSSNLSISSDMTVAVYVNDISQAREFESQLQQNNCRIVTPVSTLPVRSSAHQVHQVARSISSPISSYITLSRGSLLEQQAEVYVNSTNSNLDLKTGSLSNILLKTCGNELQKECSKYAPLKTGDVAVTEAKNLKCNFIYHVALPDFKSDHNASRKFRTTVQMILRTAKEKGAKSLAIPSLGVGILNYPAQVSAKILFEEIIAFHARNPGSDVKYYLVVYEKNIHQEFSKEYAQKMNSAPPLQKGFIISKAGKSTKLSVEKSDISDEDVDIVVNTTTENMKLNESAVSKALLKKAGPMLQSACDQLVSSGLKLDHGEIVTTKSYGSLQCKKIIHAHLPPLSATSKAGIDHFSLIVDIVKKCLAKAESEGMESISFPAFGFGQGGYSVSQVATPMLTAFRDFGRSNPKSVRTIRIIIFDSALHKEFSDFLNNFFNMAPRKFNLMSILSKSSSSDNSVELQDGVDAATAMAPPRSYDEPISNPLVLFKIYASSDDKCDKIASQLKKVIKVNYKTEEIKDPIIANLIGDDIADIKRIGSQHQVQVNMMTAINQIRVLGEKSDVALSVMDIMKIITDIKKVESELKFFQWQTESDSDSDIEPYSDADCFKLERAHMKKLPAIEIIIDGIEVVIDLDKMEERSKETGDVRKVARVPNSNIKLPDTWEPQPQEAGGKPETMHMFEVASGSAEYREALKRFQETIGSTTVQVVKLERIQNPNEYHKHNALFETVSQKHHNKKIEMKQLFHGCREDSVLPIATQGFNRNFAAEANAAVFGRGAYFALNSSYSAQTKYSMPNKDGHQFMFISRVIIGEYTAGNESMKVAPPLQKGSLEVFDTLVNKKDNPTIFVAMTDAQAYPEYLITFKGKS